MELDRQAIERRDFPIGRRGYDTAAVDAHLRAIGEQVEELRRASAAAPEQSLATAASSQVQSILAAAEQAAADIEREAQQAAREARDSADRDARRTRDDAVAKARAHITAVEHAAAELLERVGALEREASALTDALRSGASRLASDLAALQEGVDELYDAASGQTVTRAVSGERSQPSVPAPAAPERPEPRAEVGAPSPGTPPLSPPEETAPEVHPDPDAPAGHPSGAAPSAPAAAGDVDGARLVALNMALNGESRADTERYLAEHYQLADRAKLVEEVYAAIEG